MTYDSTELRNPDDLPLYGENLARSITVTSEKSGRSLCCQLRNSLRRLGRSHSALFDANSGEALPPAAEWLLDNFYLARREGAQALSDLKAAKRLPQSGSEAALSPLCRGLIRSGEGGLSVQRIRLFFEGCQRVYVLNRRELSVLLPVLRSVIIFELSELYAQSTLTDETAVYAERLFGGLRLLATTDFTGLLSDIDKAEQLFLTDPADIYPQMAEKTREHYKRRLEKLAKKSKLSEHHLAEHILKLSRSASNEGSHIGYYLFTRPLDEEQKTPSANIYIILLLASSSLAACLLGLAFKSIPLALMVLFPLYSIIKTLLDRILLFFTPPAHIPRLELSEGVPPEGRSLCVITTLLTSEDDGQRLGKKLEEYCLGSRDCGENLVFGLLADLPDSEANELHSDDGIVFAANAAVSALNEKYGGGFYLFLRNRSYNKTAGHYMAWERKRGAVMELAQHLNGEESGILLLSGNGLGLRGVNYILTLDEDTRLTPGSARELIGAMLHPLNTAVIDEEKKVVISGRGIIHPRISTELSAVNRTPFSRLFAPQGGSDPYGSDSSELYMDVFGNGGFAGKGIISVSALLTCLDGQIPDNTVLSHDALEGSYLRGGFMGDVELTDSFPSSLLSYQRRAHRWMRGDWQNLPWLFARGKGFTALDRFRLGDSVRRAVEPLSYMVTLLTAFFLPSFITNTAAIITLSAMAFELVLCLIRLLFRKSSEISTNCRSGLLCGHKQAAVVLSFRLLFLPYNAFNSLSSAALALWRMLISRRHLLDWTTSSALERSKNDFLRFVGAMLPSIFIAVASLLSPSIIGKASGIFWLLSPLSAYDLSRSREKKPILSEDERSYLLQSAKRMWSFFDNFCTAREHYLPPDNFQQQPDERLARRTSPTNIGLCLVSCLCAIDLELTNRENALGLIENILATLRRMPKWQGNLYNWYDTETLRPLHPSYVSTVDCGNLVACLVVLEQGLSELEQERLAKQCHELLEEMSLAPFYDESRRLFTIGFDAEKGVFSSGCYDLMASEALITSFVAISRGDVPKKHWRQLSRALTESGSYRGMASWTGSMFEYMMPRLFFTSLRGSMLYETQQFCVGVQRSRTAKEKLPWGISESAYFSLDASLSYRYKAHGCADLALKRGMDRELVVSPYSSFLALPCAPRAAVRNLRALDAMGATCAYGFWDAADFTPSRCDCHESRLVLCIMAHHIGMSIIAAANALLGDIIPRRLMRVAEISAHSILLHEKLPLEGIVIRRREKRLPSRPSRGNAVYWEKRGDFADPASPACCALSNGVYSLLLTDGGISRGVFRGIAPYDAPTSALSLDHGIDLHLLRSNELIPLLPTPDMPQNAQSDWEFAFSGAKINTLRDSIRTQVLFSVPSDMCGEKRVISISGQPGVEETGSLIISLRPVLLPHKEYAAHRAFGNLGIHAKMHGGALILHRLRRGCTPETYMCLAASQPLECSARGELIPGRGGLLTAITEHLPSPLGWLSNPYVFAAVPIRVSESADNAVSVVLTVGGSEAEVYSAACRMLTGETSPSSYPAHCAARLSMTEKEAEAAMELLPALCYPSGLPHPRSELWKFGISGDYPVLVRPIESAEAIPQAQEQARALCFLSSLGHPYDLLLLCSEGGDYMRPVSAALSSLRQGMGSDSSHLHIIDSTGEADILKSFSVSLRERGLSRRGIYAFPDSTKVPPQALPEYQWLPDGSFRFRVNHSLPPRAWSNVLTNGRFGVIASDCGSGIMWYKNAREYAINPPPKSVYDTQGSESLTLNSQSVFATASDTDCAVSFGMGFVTWEKTISGTVSRTTAFVPMDTDARVIIVQWDDGEKKSLAWFTDLILGGGEQPDGLSVVGQGGVFRVSTPAAPFKNADFIVCSNAELTGFTANRETWLRGDVDDRLDSPDCLGLNFKGDSPFVLVCGCDKEEKLKELLNPAAAIAAFEKTCAHWEQAVSSVEIETPLPALDRLVNVWLPYQALACRLLARCSLYQSGGAFGFRDQLQDVINLIVLDSSLARNQIIQSCRHQYTDGDVMHWWHELDTGERGVRTRCSDDLIWLPWALCEYVEKTGDTALCHESVPWLVSHPLEKGERDRYEQASASPMYSSVLEHATKALDLVLGRGCGPHGLLKIGGGDWNDGFSSVGIEGKGESVWLTWFCSEICTSFAALLKKLSVDSEADKYLSASALLSRAADEAWDGAWYLRGYFDNGKPLGSSKSSQCQIDSIAQSFAALCHQADSDKVNTALSSAVSRLFNSDSSTTALFTPPFKGSQPDPGYIQSYGPGFRENGGQYTHAAIWLIMALLRKNRRDEALKLLKALIPELRDTSVYEAEPFVLAADVYTTPGCPGRAGWSWYTGAAGWLYRVVTEELLGIKLKNNSLILSPRIPEDWEHCRVRYRSPTGGITDIEVSGKDIAEDTAADFTEK